MARTSLALAASLALASVVVLAPSSARARKWPFFEGTGGVVTPLGASNYQDMAKISPVGGFHAGAFFSEAGAARRLGFEVAADFTYIRNTLARDAYAESDVFRIRIVGGARVEYPLGGRLYGFGRVLAGLDLVVGSVDDLAAGTYVREEKVSLGPVVAPGGGLLWRFTDVNVGVQGGLPISYHHDGDLGDRTPDFDYVGLELETLFSVGGEW